MVTRTMKRLAQTGAGASALTFAQKASATVYDGCGLECGIKAAMGITGVAKAQSLRELILTIIAFILNIVLLIAVVAIIIAGLYLITSNGDEGQKDKAKKIIYYVILGIILILFARILVMLVSSIFS